MRTFKAPPETLERPAAELDQWVRACRGGAPSDASFTSVAPFAETILLGNIALRVPKKLHWMADEGRFADAREHLTKAGYRDLSRFDDDPYFAEMRAHPDYRELFERKR